MSDKIVKWDADRNVQMEIAGITLDPTNNMPIVILKSADSDVAIPIWIGLIEASAIATELEGIKLARPMTHDLLKSLLENLGGNLLRVLVSDLRENTYYATLFVRQGDEIVEIDSRPSDAIALALRTGADIFVSNKVIESSKQVDITSLKDVTEYKNKDNEFIQDKDKWTEILHNLNPEDFGKYKM